MANWVAIRLFFFFFFISHAVQVVKSDDAADINSWCSRTPYPQTCKYYMSHAPRAFTPKPNTDYHKLAIEITLDRALKAQVHTLGLGKACRNELEKAAWTDCLELYENTIMQLNRTLCSPTRSLVDVQTWLSAALTNYETCCTGFRELSVSSFMLPLVTNNVSKLISNSLSIVKLPSVGEPIPGRRLLSDGFPVWVSAADRKLLQSASPAAQANLVVAQDGSGNFKTIAAATEAASKSNSGSKRFVIYVKAGVYNENVRITMKNLKFVGDGIGKTVVTGSKSVQGGSTTFNSATFAVTGDGFVATGMTFRNTAGAAKHQAVALRVGSDQSVFYRCSIEGYQDTLYVYSLRQFYRECDVYGTVDFIFGNAAAVLQNCNIYVRKPMSQQENTITAQARSDPNQNTGISIHDSRVTAAAELIPVQSSFKTFLGRPWRQYSRTVFMETFLDSLINPAGWLQWDGNFALNTLYYGEYQNTGPGSSTGNRVKWTGYHVITSPSVASTFTVGSFISGGSWIPATGVPFTSGL